MKTEDENVKRILLSLSLLLLLSGGAAVADGPCSIDNPDCETFHCEVVAIGFWAAQEDPGCLYSGVIYRDCLGHVTYVVTTVSCP